ncbi:hypothetical protein DL765_005815 [Monosporascus sp. GIB2]|nr:hypothetical protein DL765_005815 [Monosporascus sp. GIB2]
MESETSRHNVQYSAPPTETTGIDGKALAWALSQSQMQNQTQDNTDHDGVLLDLVLEFGAIRSRRKPCRCHLAGRAARNPEPIGPDLGGAADIGITDCGRWHVYFQFQQDRPLPGQDEGQYHLTLQYRMLEIMDKRLTICSHMWHPSAFPFKTENGVTWQYYDGPKNFDIWVL